MRVFALSLTVMALASGCATVGYYAHAVGGQLELLARAEPIDALLEPERAGDEPVAPVTPDLRARLATVLRIRAFASDVLALPDNGSYRQYVRLDRAAVAWNVIATPEFSLTADRWCYPFAGCVPYRGFFAQDRAGRFAEELRRDGRDVRIARVAAYSTLGWFRDPVLSTHLQRTDVDLAALLFHELAHQQLYVTDDAAFNESFATFVEQEGLRRWLVGEGRAADFDRWRTERDQQEAFVSLLREYRGRLDVLYRSALPAGPMREAKARVFDELRKAYRERRHQWGGDRYDAWFEQDLNNAHLAGVDLYHRHVPAFAELFLRAGGDLRVFYRAASELSRLPPAERDARLSGLIETRLSTRG